MYNGEAPEYTQLYDALIAELQKGAE